jgi:hypothetical protein
MRGHCWVGEGIHPDCVVVVPQNYPARFLWASLAAEEGNQAKLL